MQSLTRTLTTCSFLVLGACSGGEGPTAEPHAGSLPGPVAQPQLILEEDGTLLVVWRGEGDEGSDLYIAERHSDGSFSPTTRVNDVAGTVSGYDLDELRASVAIGPDGRIAVAWGDTQGDVRVALGSEHGRSFEPSLRMNQNQQTGAQSFPSIAYDEEGVLHAVWLDTRVSGSVEEEPADLYYARVTAEGVTEKNLTDDDSPSVCGCCRPGIAVGMGGEVVVAFRNTSTDGYRDIFQVSGSLASGFDAPARIGPPLWELAGCPMAGPLPLGKETLWNDASTGERRTLIAESRDAVPRVLLSSAEEGTILYPPRRVSGGDDAWLLVPADPMAFLLHRDEEAGWVVVSDDLPRWATSAALVGGDLLIAGSEHDQLLIEERPSPF